jgi:hypothetical protein
MRKLMQKMGARTKELPRWQLTFWAVVGFVLLVSGYFVVVRQAYSGVFNGSFGLDDPRLIFIMAGLKDDPIGALTASLQFNRLRPVSDFAYWSAFNLVGFDFNAWLNLGLLVWSVTCAVFTIFIAKMSKSWILSIGLGLLLLSSRFAFYQVTNVTGLMENIASLELVVFVILLWGYFRTGGSNRYFWGSLVVLLCLVFTHERFQGLTLVLLVIALLHPVGQPLRQRAVRSMASLVPAILLTGAKLAVWSIPLFVGTGSSSGLGFSWETTRDHLIAAGLNLVGINWGPAYLVGQPFEAHPQWFQMLVGVQAATLVLVGIVVTFGFLSANREKRWSELFPQSVNSFLTPILLGLLLVALIIPVVITIRIEQRWLLTPFIVALLFVSQFPRVTDHFRATTKVVTNAAVVLFVGTGLIANATYFREMEPLFFIGHQSLATVNTMVANSAVENNTISVSEDCATPIATQYLDHLLFANNDGKRVTVTCVGLTPPPGTTFVRLADDGFIELSQ